MQKAIDFIGSFFRNRFFGQLILAAFMIGMAAFFISHEHIEILKIREQLAESNALYVILGIAVTILYLFLQGMMYDFSFRTVGTRVPLFAAIILFLKRNLVSVFLPAGGFSSLAFFSRDIEEKGVSKSQIHLASVLFGVIGILSVIVVAIPVLSYALLAHDLGKAELWGFAFLILLSSFLIFSLYSISVKGVVYRWISSLWPSFVGMLDDMKAQRISRGKVLATLGISICIEFIGILHLYIAMLALGYEPSLPAAIVGYVVMVILLIASPFLRGLGAIEISITFILGQFGFPLIAAASITLLFRFFEFWLPLITSVFSFIRRKDNFLLRVLPAFIIAILGIINIVSALTPAVPARLRLLQDLLPDNLIVISNGLVLVFGLLLVILSVFLLQGSKRAWYVGVFLSGFSLVGHLLKGVDYEEALIASAAIAALAFNYSSYRLKPHPKLTRISYWILIYSIAALFLFGITGFYLIDKRHFGVDFSLWESCKAIFHMFFLFDTGGLVPKTPFARDFIFMVYSAGAIVLSFTFFGYLIPYFSKPYNSEEDKELAKRILEKYGNSPLDYFKTYQDKLFFIAENRDGFISFKISRYFMMALENPVCKDNKAMEKIIKEFDNFCEENGYITAFYRVPPSSVNIYRKLGKKSLPIGEEAILNLTAFTMEGGKMKTTRSAINRLTSEGFTCKIYEPPIKKGLLQKLKQVSDDWLDNLHQKELTFTQGVFDVDLLANHTIITLEDEEEKVYAFLNIIPDYAPGDATYDLVRKITEAPNGVLDMLLAKTFLYLKEKEYKTCNLGLAPLSGVEGVNLTEKSIKYAYENLKPFAHFKGLRKYKDKFFPEWEPRYLIYNHNYQLMQVPLALKRVSESN